MEGFLQNSLNIYNMISIICPIYNEEKYIEKCINSILGQDYPHSEMEVLLIDGMSSDKTREIVQFYQKKYPFIRLLDNPDKIVPFALNIGVKEAKGDIIIRLDAHAYYPTNYFSCLVQNLVYFGVDNIGAVCKTDVFTKNAKTLSIREVLSNRFGVGNSLFRIGIKAAMEVDTVPFGCWRKSVFEKYGLFDTRLVRNQDIEFNKRIVRNGGKIMIIPDTYSIYYARETFQSIIKNNYENGKWNILTIKMTKELKSLSIRHFIPLLFLLSLIIPSILSLFYFPLIFVSLASLSLYMLMVIIISLRISIRKGINIFYLILSFFSLHLSYGYGALVGIFKCMFV